MINVTSRPVYQVLEEASKQRGLDKKVEVLKQNESFALKSILQGIFDPNIKFLLPEGGVPDGFYKPSEFDERTRLHREARKFVYLVEGGPQLTRLKRELIFKELLETVIPEEAKLIIAMKDKKCPFKGINKEVVATAFPELGLGA